MLVKAVRGDSVYVIVAHSLPAANARLHRLLLLLLDLASSDSGNFQFRISYLEGRGLSFSFPTANL